MNDAAPEGDPRGERKDAPCSYDWVEAPKFDWHWGDRCIFCSSSLGSAADACSSFTVSTGATKTTTPITIDPRLAYKLTRVARVRATL